MSNAAYWERRKAREMFQYMQSAEGAADDIARLYQKSSGYISHELDKIFDRYKRKYHLTNAEAYRLLNDLKDKTSIDELKQALRAGDGIKKDILAELESPAYQARLERLQQLQNQIDLTMKQVYKQEKARSTSHYVDLAHEAYYRSMFSIQQQTGFGFAFSMIDHRAIDRAINSRWSGANYSGRIWHNTQALAQSLKQELLINLTTGRTDGEVADILANKYAQGASNARRLVRTESCNLANQMEMESYKECGIEKYRYVATLDLRTSSTCREMDGRVFPVSEQQPGVNCPPMHPWCRSTTICDIGAGELSKMQRRARDPVTGRTNTVPADMTYKQWHEENVAGRPEAEQKEAMMKNRAADKGQFEKYQSILEKDAPKDLDSFQKMKYTDSESWKFTKLDYQRRSGLVNHPERKLPNAEKANAADAKFTKYLFDGDNLNGLSKGKAFTSRLGYDIDNWQKLQEEIINRSLKYPAVSKGNVGFGEKYEQKIVLYGLKGKPANVVVGWIHKPDGTASMTSVYIKEV